MQRLLITAIVLVVILAILGFIWRDKIPWERVKRLIKREEALVIGGITLIAICIASLNSYLKGLEQIEYHEIRTQALLCEAAGEDGQAMAKISTTNRTYIASNLSMTECEKLRVTALNEMLVVEVNTSPGLLDRLNGYESTTDNNLQVKGWRFK